jgi:hypothetical protein
MGILSEMGILRQPSPNRISTLIDSRNAEAQVASRHGLDRWTALLLVVVSQQDRRLGGSFDVFPIFRELYRPAGVVCEESP